MTRACSDWLNAPADQRERHRRDGGTCQSVKSTRYQEHSTRLRDRCKQGCANHAEGAEHEHATPAIDVTRDAAGEHKGAEHQLAKGDGDLHDRRRCTQVAAHRAQRKVHDRGAHLVRKADQHASGKKPPATPLLCAHRRLCEGSFVAHNGGILGSRLQNEHSGSGVVSRQSYPILRFPGELVVVDFPQRIFSG